MEPITIDPLEPSFAACLPETCAMIRSAGLVVHPLVEQVTLHGSRGLARNYRPTSDIDLSLLLSIARPPVIDEALEHSLQEVIDVTLTHWNAPVEADLAVIFPLHDCRLACFQVNAYDPALCPLGGSDCFGIYKNQKGFTGFVLQAGIQVQRMYPCITIWRQPQGLPS